MAGYRGVLFDLFGTLIGVAAERLPELAVDDRAVRSTLGGLTGLLGEIAPGVPLPDVWQALVTASDELAQARSWDHVELPSRERFRRALALVGCEESACDEGAVLLSRAHMRLIAEATVFPDEHAALLRVVRATHRVAVVSNFDDTATGYEILRRHGILDQVDVVVISEGLGLRKPHPALVRVPLRELGMAPAEALLVGDTFAEDVGAAHAAGVDCVWIDGRGAGVPETAGVRPRWVIRRLAELAPILGLGSLG